MARTEKITEAPWPGEITWEIECRSRRAPKAFQFVQVSNREQSQQKRLERIASKAREKNQEGLVS